VPNHYCLALNVQSPAKRGSARNRTWKRSWNNQQRNYYISTFQHVLPNPTRQGDGQGLIGGMSFHT